MAQSLSKILVHIIFSTRDRKPLIHPDIETELHAYVAKICNDMKCRAILVNGTKTHLHILCLLGRTTTVASLVEVMKKRSSRWMKKKRNDLASFQWQNGYGAFSIGESSAKTLKEYISRQKEHHRKTTFQEEFVRFLEKYGVEYDEEYLWR